MKYYCGIDLGATHSHLCVVDEALRVCLQEKVRNDLPTLLSLLDTYKTSLQIVVESTFNWYWLIDGLQEAGYDVRLAHTLGLFMITAAKVKTDKRDAFALAKLLRIGTIPAAFIYPKETRPLRDLLRRRSSLVHARATEYGTLRSLLLRHGIISCSRNSVKRAEDEELIEWFDHPFVKLHAGLVLDRIRLFTGQIETLEKTILAQCSPLDAFGRLRGVPGIGTTLAMTIYYEIGDISRFDNARRFSSYCRLVPGIAQSGSTLRRGRGSKQGNPHLKWAFSQAALYAVRYYPKIRTCYERHLQRHRGRARKLIAYNVIAHKLALAVYHVLKHNAAYQEKLLFGS